MINKKPYKPIGPFRGWVLQNFPFIEDDFDALTYYQLLCKVIAYVNKIGYNQELLEDANDELIDAFNTLENYVDNYFENLDVQEEINNKLDEMAESGQLTDIIAQYLQLAGILAYNTLDDLENAENLVAGSFTRIYGKVTYNDGYGAFYKIRALINTDVIDGDNLVALVNYPTLVAEKMPDATIDSILTDLSNLTTKVDTMLDDNRTSVPLRYYIDGVNGDDSNDGLTSSTAFKTIDKWLEIVNYRSDLRCYIISAGTYTISKRVLSDCVLHIESTTANNTDVVINTINDGNLVFYNCHLNFENLTVDKIDHIENTATTFVRCKINSEFTIYGGGFKFDTTILKGFVTEYANGYMDSCTIDSQPKIHTAPIIIENGSIVRIRVITFEQPTSLLTDFIKVQYSSLVWGGTFNYTKLNDPDLDYSRVSFSYAFVNLSNSLYNTLSNNYTLNNDAGLLVHGSVVLPS